MGAGMVSPWGIGFRYDLPNKPLSDFYDLQMGENKRDDLQDQENAGAMVFLESDTNRWLVVSVPTLQASIWVL
jgi:hypothetical protein